MLSLRPRVTAGLAYVVWNYGYKQGTTGSSIGKGVMKFKVVSEKTWSTNWIRTCRSCGSWPTSWTPSCYIGFLFPLWDAKRQTFADKIMTTVCVPVS